MVRLLAEADHESSSSSSSRKAAHRAP